MSVSAAESPIAAGRLRGECVADTPFGRGTLGVVDGGSPLRVEDGADIEARKRLLREFGYKL